MVSNGSIYFLSRPRRFGKSLLVSTIECYFSGKKELFKGLAMERLETEWKTYPVFHIDFNSTVFQDGKALRNLIKGIVESWEKDYGYDGNPNYDSGKRFAELLAYIHRTTGKRSVVLIDEYDKPLLDVLDTDIRMCDDNGNKVLIEDYNRNILLCVARIMNESVNAIFTTRSTSYSASSAPISY